MTHKILRNSKKIAYLTGTRADFGLLKSLLDAINSSPILELHLYATGMHLMPKHGLTIEEVKKFFPTVTQLPVTFSSNQPTGIAQFSASLLQAVVTEFDKNKPDLLLVLGDRVEMLTAAVACLYLGIPVAHVHGGDKTGTVDDSARHAITKLSHIHFAPTPSAQARIIAMGEEAWRVHLVGATGLDSVLNTRKLTREQLCRKLNLDPKKHILLVLQHPVSEEVTQSGAHMRETLKAVTRCRLPTVIIYPNSDAGSHEMIELIEQHRSNKNVHIFANIDHDTFISLEQHADVWIGNSSGGIVESTALKTPVVNVGTRQQGREKGANIIDVPYNSTQIFQAIQTCLHDKQFKDTVQHSISPWGDGTAPQKILQLLEQLTLNQRLLTKL